MPAAASVWTRDDLRAASGALIGLFEAKATDPDGRIRVEDLLSAAAAACGEACIAAAGELDPNAHDFTPGSLVLSDRINGILCRDANDWAMTGESVFGIIWSGAGADDYAGSDFPALDEPFRSLVASVGGDVPWGYVPLSVPESNRPRVEPLRQAYELRDGVTAIMREAGLSVADWPSACALAVAVELARVRATIDHGVATRIVLETINGMAKMAPMTERHLREASAG